MKGKAIDWTPELIERLCGEISCGRSITDVANEKWCPSEPSIYRRMATDSDFAAKVTVARSAQQDFMADQCVEMADNATPEDWQVVKLRIWARQWRAAKLAPKKYGERVEQHMTGELTINVLPRAVRQSSE
jgi:hypothetical protein